MNEIVRYDAMCQAIAACHSVDEVAEMHNKALALEVYARQAMNVEAERKATEIRLRAERKAGQMMRELKRAPTAAGGDTREKRPEAAGNGGHPPPQKSTYAETIDRVGIAPRTARRWQVLADVPEAEFEQHLADPDKKPTTTGILNTTVNGATRVTAASIALWARLRDFERDQIPRTSTEDFGGMTETMQADVRRRLPAVIKWLTDFKEAIR